MRSVKVVLCDANERLLSSPGLVNCPEVTRGDKTVSLLTTTSFDTISATTNTTTATHATTATLVVAGKNKRSKQT